MTQHFSAPKSWAPSPGRPAAETLAYAQVVEALKRTVQALDPAAERPRLPPILAAHHLQATNYFRNFPHLLGLISCFCGDEAAHRNALSAQSRGDAWTADFDASGHVLTPAACLPVYPWAAQERLTAEGQLIFVCSWCYRHEPSVEPGRLQAFEMAEYVRIGRPEQVQTFRDAWIKQAAAFATSLELNYTLRPANDPFFGRAGGVMAKGQREAGLKFELTAPLAHGWQDAACISFNYHQDHFGRAFGMLCDGETAHSACVGFGLDRLALALLHRHGDVLDRWPDGVRAALQLQVSQAV